MGLLKEQVRRVKEGTSAVLLQSGLNENWWADSMECYTYLRNVTDLSKKRHGRHGRKCCTVQTPRIHLFVCTHPSVSNTCDFKHVWMVVPCMCTSIGLQSFVQTRVDCGSLFVYKHQSPALCFKHVWIVVPCLTSRNSLQPCVSNTFGVWFSVGVHASVNSPLLQTRLIMGCLFIYPPAHTKIMVTPELEKILHRAIAPNPAVNLLEKEQLFGVDDVALVCMKEHVS